MTLSGNLSRRGYNQLAQFVPHAWDGAPCSSACAWLDGGEGTFAIRRRASFRKASVFGAGSVGAKDDSLAYCSCKNITVSMKQSHLAFISVNNAKGIDLADRRPSNSLAITYPGNPKESLLSKSIVLFSTRGQTCWRLFNNLNNALSLKYTKLRV